MSNILDQSTIRVGHVFDGLDDGLPGQAAVLKLENDSQAELIVPFLRWDDEVGAQNRKTRVWFRIEDEAFPKSLLFLDNSGVVMLTGLRISSVRRGAEGAALGRVKAETIILGKPKSYRDEYLVEKFISRIDGLAEFTGYRPVEIADNWDAEGQLKTTVTLSADECVEWEYGEFQYKIQSNVSWQGDNTDFKINDGRPFLSTKHSTGASVSDHLKAQAPIRALLILVHGTKLAWRSHQLIDEEFPLWMLNNSARGAHPVSVQTASTVAEHYLPIPEIKDIRHALLGISDLGESGLERWIELYTDQNFKRAVQPAVEVLNGASRFLEPQLMMLAISLDYFGYFRFGDGKRRPLSNSILKCLQDIGLDFSEIGSAAGIAKLIATINNDLKHPDRERAPESDVLRIVTNLAKVIVRAQIFDLLSVEERIRDHYVQYGDARRAIDYFIRNGIAITDDGMVSRK